MNLHFSTICLLSREGNQDYDSGVSLAPLKDATTGTQKAESALIGL